MTLQKWDVLSAQGRTEVTKGSRQVTQVWQVWWGLGAGISLEPIFHLKWVEVPLESLHRPPRAHLWWQLLCAFRWDGSYVPAFTLARLLVNPCVTVPPVAGYLSKKCTHLRLHSDPPLMDPIPGCFHHQEAWLNICTWNLKDLFF